MKRRSLLKGLGFAGGATLLAPLASRLVRASESNPKFVFVVEGNCVEPRAFLADSARAALAPTVDTTDRRWWYRDYNHDAPILVDSADMASAASCAPLAEMASEATAVFGLSCKISGGGHTASHGPLSSARTIGSSPGGITIDAYLAANAPCLAERPFPAVRLGVGADPLNPDTCALDAGRAVPLLQRPATAYQVLFGAAATGAAGEAFQRRGSMLDFVADDIAQARDTFTGGSFEREKLERYLEAVRAIEVRQEQLLANRDRLASVAPEGPETNPLFAATGHFEQLALQFDIATAALQGELTNVVVLGSGTGGKFDVSYPSISSISRHDMHHMSGGDASMRDAIRQVSERHVELIANMARTLAATPDGDGTMLDNTVIVYLGDNGEQHHSTASEFPLLMVGGRGLGIRPGRTLIYPGLGNANHRQLSNVWNTLGHLAGLDLNAFGAEGPTRVAPGPLSELTS